MKVLAAPGTRCPMEGQPRKYITDKAAVEVTETAHYLRRLRDGSLIRATAAAPAQMFPAQGVPAQAASIPAANPVSATAPQGGK
jgi:hypothetical protein